MRWTIITFIYHDGGRKEAGYKGHTNDCVVRAIAIATEKPYHEVYDAINAFAKLEETGERKRGRSHARLGVYPRTYHKYLRSIGWKYTPTYRISDEPSEGFVFLSSTRLRPDDLPNGRIIVCLEKHVCAVIDGVIYDTYDRSRGGKAYVWGYFNQEVTAYVAIPQEIPPQERPEMGAIREALLSGDRIKAIKLYSSVYRVGLKESKDALDAMYVNLAWGVHWQA